MLPNPIRTWREFLLEFWRTGVFSLQPPPTTQAERDEAEQRDAARRTAMAKNSVRLNLDAKLPD